MLALRITHRHSASPLSKVFFETDEEIRTHPEIQLSAVSSGTTVLLAVLHRFSLWVANCGDSAAVLGTRRLKLKNRGGKGGADDESGYVDPTAVGGMEEEEYEVVARKV